jgi:hypothetical protein
MSHSRLQRVYFETSAVNRLQEQLDWEVALNTRAYQNLRGRGYFISPLVIFEILSTSDANRREELIFFSQHIFEPTLLPSPEELIVSFVEAECPKIEPEYDLTSRGKIAQHWRNICHDRRKTLLYDHAEILARSKVLRELGKLLFEFHEHKELKPAGSDFIEGANLTVFQIIQRYGLGKTIDLEDRIARQHVGLVTLLVIFILCAGVTLDSEPIERFWQRKEIPDFESLLFDSLHAIYTMYSDNFMTADNHFRALKEWLPDNVPLKYKIQHLDDIEVRMVETSGAPEPKGWLDP